MNHPNHRVEIVANINRAEDNIRKVATHKVVFILIQTHPVKDNQEAEAILRQLHFRTPIQVYFQIAQRE